MMTNNTNEIKKVTGYKIDFESNTIYMNYKFAAAADSYGSQEYRIMTMILKDFPDMRRVVQAGRKVTSAHKNKRLTYENMEKHIKAYENSQTLLDSFNTVKKMSQVTTSPYKYVLDWFTQQFPNYKEVPTLRESKLYVLPINPPKVEDYKVKATRDNLPEASIQEA